MFLKKGLLPTWCHFSSLCGSWIYYLDLLWGMLPERFIWGASDGIGFTASNVPFITLGPPSGLLEAQQRMHSRLLLLIPFTALPAPSASLCINVYFLHWFLIHSHDFTGNRFCGVSVSVSCWESNQMNALLLHFLNVVQFCFVFTQLMLLFSLDNFTLNF